MHFSLFFRKGSPCLGGRRPRSSELSRVFARLRDEARMTRGSKVRETVYDVGSDMAHHACKSCQYKLKNHSRAAQNVVLAGRPKLSNM
eukprot:6208057-Pleurochrysis_carterae.AAC.2